MVATLGQSAAAGATAAGSPRAARPGTPIPTLGGPAARRGAAEEKYEPRGGSLEFRFDSEKGVLTVREGESGRTLYELRLRESATDTAVPAETGRLVDVLA